MKRWIFWSFGRGSFQYDVLCALILIAMFAIPPSLFNDRPEYMRIPDSGVRVVEDGDGNTVYTVKADRPAADEAGPAGTDTLELVARSELERFLGSDQPPDVFRFEIVRDTRGVVAAYAYWLR